MENLTHSRQPNRSGSTLAAKKPYNNGNGGVGGLYDDVYGGPPRFGVAPTLSPRAEDYGEIFESFHASRATSIPVLDLPAVDEEGSEVFFDVRSSGFDYSEVFGGGGGGGGLDFAVSYEDLLFDLSNGRDFHSSEEDEEAWTPAGSVSPSEESDHFENNHCFSNGDGNVEFNMSYHKATLTSNEDLYQGTTQLSELHGVPGFSFVFDEDTPLQRTEDDIPFLQVTDDDNLNRDFSVGMMKGKHLKKTISQPLNGIADGQEFGYNLKPEKVYRRSGSLPNGFVTVSDISLRTQPSHLPPPSRPPPAADVRNEGSGQSTPNGNSVASEGSAGDSSPPFFDVEVDASSSAAASAAAMKEAMMKAKAKLRSAKEFMDRKKEGFQGSAKTGSKNHNLDKVEKVSKIVDECNSLGGEGLQSSCDIEDNGIEFSVREERQKVIKTAQEVSVSTGGKHQKVAKKSKEKKHGKESLSSLVSDKIDGGSEWKEESQFFELVRTDTSDKALETNHVQTSVHNTKIHERGQKDKMAVMGVFEQQEEDIRKVKSARGNNELEYEKKSKVAHQACEGEENNGRSKAAKEVHRQKGHVKKEKVAQEVSEQVENVKKVRIAQKPLESEKKSTGVDILENCNNLVDVQQKEYAFEVEQAMKHKENNEQQLKEDKKRRESEKRLKESCEREDNEKIRSEAFGWEEIEEGLKGAPEQSKHAKILKEAHEQKESEKRLKEVIERDEIKKKQKEACIRQEDEKRLKEALEQEERKKRLQKVLEQEEHEKRLKEALEREEDEKKQKELHKGEENEKRLDEGLEWEESEKKQEACEIEENEKIFTDACEKEDEKTLYGASEQAVNSDKLKGAQERRELDGRSQKGIELEESKKEPKEASTCEETGKRLKDAGGKEELKGLNIVHEQSEGDDYRKAQKLAKGICVHMDGEDLGVSDGAQKLEDNGNLQAPKLACTNDKHGGKLEETQEALAQEENGKKKSELKNKEKDSEVVETANVLVGEKSNQFRTEDAKKSPHLDDGVKKAGEPVVGVRQTHIFKSKSLSQLDSDPINKERKFAHELGERGNNTKQTQTVLNQEESKDAVMSTHVIKDGIENGRKIEAARPAMVEIKGNIQKPAVRVNASQTTERKEKNLNESLTSEDKETERMKRERELEMDRLRKIEEEREREREREKDRMAIDRATLEARERAYSEARERADRAAVERAMAEARERLEKACAEAREKSFVEKASMEARIRVERAAVERATAEARERAVGKAMADKASFETRERADRSVSDKYLASFRSSEMKQSSSVYGAAYYTERPEGVEGESAQRCKARLERHQRTTERAAKALAEKNMRDLLAQREQAERNRLAETLDADVRRWSSGKEGNLRALLSTLQYILGPDSGWQPIPLTDVITSAAVKKAYRKATLCVHPDKLQQRGASIQQKYICEKVFDLLKEAWNKFNSEER